eukprot:c467_g1_i1 orf=161-346(-)
MSLFADNNLVGVDFWWTAHVFSWIYEEHNQEISLCLEILNAIEILISMIHEVINNDYHCLC